MIPTRRKPRAARGRLGAIWVAVALIGVLAVVHVVQSRRGLDSAALLPSTLPFPDRHIGPFGYGEGELDWGVRATGTEPMDCAFGQGKAKRHWSYGGERGSGEPLARAEACQTPSPLVAIAEFAATEPRDAARPLGPDELTIYPTDESVRHADQSRIDCFWRETDTDCRIWMLTARYGQYLVRLQLGSGGQPGDQFGSDAFERMADALDAFVDRQLRGVDA